MQHVWSGSRILEVSPLHWNPNLSVPFQALLKSHTRTGISFKAETSYVNWLAFHGITKADDWLALHDITKSTDWLAFHDITKAAASPLDPPPKTVFRVILYFLKNKFVSQVNKTNQQKKWAKKHEHSWGNFYKKILEESAASEWRGRSGGKAVS